ncbi:MAG: HepT-like ribonuclease domain-containing protein [Pirellulales bacterium]
MLSAARAVVRFTAGYDLPRYLSDEILQAAVERKLEIIGEAARHISPAFQNVHSGIPWEKIRGQRNVIAHDYGRIEHDRLWAVVSVHLPVLIAQIEVVMPDDIADA